MEDNEFSRAWQTVGQTLPRPRAVLCISAHWETAGTRVAAMPDPQTLYDFHGFPKQLYEIRYPAPGAPDLASDIKHALGNAVHLDYNWGLDHGAWSVLRRLFPQADVPVLQLSLDFNQPPAAHYDLGRKLSYLRGQGVMVIGSGNMVHNLRTMVWEDKSFDWAAVFDDMLTACIRNDDHPTLIDYGALSDNAALAIPTNEHFLPLLYVLAIKVPADNIDFFCEKVTFGSISMRSFLLKA